jgi:hypothetical protein
LVGESVPLGTAGVAAAGALLTAGAGSDAALGLAPSDTGPDAASGLLKNRKNSESGEMTRRVAEPFSPVSYACIER